MSYSYFYCVQTSGWNKDDKRLDSGILVRDTQITEYKEIEKELRILFPRWQLCILSLSLLNPDLPCSVDDPTLDDTDFAHPAWLRGHEAGVAQLCSMVNKVLDGNKGAIYGKTHEPWAATRLRLVNLIKESTPCDKTS